MRKQTTYLLGILFTIIIGTLLYCYFCDDCHCFLGREKKVVKEDTTVVAEPEPEPKTLTTTHNGFVVSDASDDFNIKVEDNFNFKTSNFSILTPVSEKVTSGVDSLKNFLSENPAKTIDITGYYRSDETNNSAFPNLGFARANAVKNYFVTHGISGKQINTKSELNDNINPDDSGALFGPVKFGVLTTAEDATDDALNEACDAIRKNPIVLYFNTGQAQINLTAEQRQKIATISRCVDKLGVKVQVVGYTDNVGDAGRNKVLGQNRADFAKAYLTRNGILNGNIETSSKGETQPIADNSTKEGREKNRRTIITIN